MKLLKVAAFAAIVVSGSALAGLVPQLNSNGHHHGGSNYGPDSSLSIYQYGSSNVANALQSDARKSDVTITQHGHGNGATVGQGADDSTISLKQTGFQNSADINQWNAKNADISVTQFGGRNGAVVNQTASDSNVLIQQVGYGNNATANQH
ncbi:MULTISPECIES: curli major subunit CsgA [Citrobacter]|uniref:Curlin major subunit CsgA n=1 Tax=Citrobacter pasteurii TaxID=1563222 RepID=A0A6N6K826_9ENTR|nr:MULTISPECIES: curli major subunit CsgA [Citrobacter]EIQ74173.1 major curlin subunit [Shigella flexneri 1235-66]KAA1279482.1 major curlin subunit CsgA [Citrobacter pasteurii]MBA4712730.1 curlin major subunit CsgA [Citrobacter pasteurii]MBA7943000.1 curlin major subunit CsgA [Citrobacter sp. RHBSTW-00271]MBD0802111.1 curlin major subunit CsgA [Citrobacter sp. C6_1]